MGRALKKVTPTFLPPFLLLFQVQSNLKKVRKKTELVRIRVKMTLIWYATIFLTSSKPSYGNAIMDFCFSGVQFRGSLQERMNLRSNLSYI